MQPILMQDYDMDSLLEQPITISNSSNVDEFNEILCRLDSLFRASSFSREMLDKREREYMFMSNMVLYEQQVLHR